MFCFVLFFLIPLFRYPRLGFNCWRVLTAMLLLPLFLIWLDGRLAGLCSICSKPNPTKFVFQNNRNFVLFQCLLWIVVFRICLLHTGICGWVVCVWEFVWGDYVVCRHWDWVKIGNVVYFFANHSISGREQKLIGIRWGYVGKMQGGLIQKSQGMRRKIYKISPSNWKKKKTEMW